MRTALLLAAGAAAGALGLVLAVAGALTWDELDAKRRADDLETLDERARLAGMAPRG